MPYYLLTEESGAVIGSGFSAGDVPEYGTPCTKEQAEHPTLYRIEAGSVRLAEMPIDVVVAQMRDAIQTHMDAQAKALGYDDIRNAVTYADEPAVPKFQAEGLALREWRSLVWAAAYEVLNACLAGTRATPTLADLLASLPTFTPPATT